MPVFVTSFVLYLKNQSVTIHIPNSILTAPSTIDYKLTHRTGKSRPAIYKVNLERMRGAVAAGPSDLAGRYPLTNWLQMQSHQLIPLAWESQPLNEARFVYQVIGRTFSSRLFTETTVTYSNWCSTYVY